MHLSVQQWRGVIMRVTDMRSPFMNRRAKKSSLISFENAVDGLVSWTRRDSTSFAELIQPRLSSDFGL